MWLPKPSHRRRAAVILLGPNLADIRGSVGGSTYARNRYGLFLRNRTKPVDPASSRQEAFRTRFSAAITNWRALTATQRTAWNVKALKIDFVNALGQAFHPSGFNLFARSDLLLDMANHPGITTPPVNPVLATPTSSVTYIADPGMEHNSVTADWPVGAHMLIFFAFNRSNSSYFWKGPYTNFLVAPAGDYAVGGKRLLVDNASLDADSSMFAAWRLVHTDGSASSMRRGRAFKPPA